MRLRCLPDNDFSIEEFIAFGLHNYSKEQLWLMVSTMNENATEEDFEADWEEFSPHLATIRALT